MIVVIKSGPGTPEAKRALSLAGDLEADLILIQNAVYLAQPGQTNGIRGAAYALEEDLRLRGIGPDADIGAAIQIDYATLVDLITQADRVHGAF